MQFEITHRQVVALFHAQRKININDKMRGDTDVLTSPPYEEEHI